MLGTNTRGPSMRIDLHPRYGLLTLTYMVGIFWLSSLGLGFREGDSLVQLTSNLFHIPLYAGLTFCLLKAVSKGQGGKEVPWELFGLTSLGTGAYAALDEWHQSFVPERSASISDFLLDLVGIGGMLLILRLGVLREHGTVVEEVTDES